MNLGPASLALATQIKNELCGTANPVIEHLQVGDAPNPEPTYPSIDMFPAEPFTEATGFGKGMKDYFLSVRARVDIADQKAGYLLLLAMMDTDADESVEQAILSNTQLSGGGVIRNVDGPVFRTYPVANIIGAVWTVRITP